MKIHCRNTYQSGADRMLFDKCWHSSKPLDDIKVGDILKITNNETGEVIDWRITEPPIRLTRDEAKTEWLKYPFGNSETAEKYEYYPFVLRNLEKVKE